MINKEQIAYRNNSVAVTAVSGIRVTHKFQSNVCKREKTTIKFFQTLLRVARMGIFETAMVTIIIVLDRNIAIITRIRSAAKHANAKSYRNVHIFSSFGLI